MPNETKELIVDAEEERYVITPKGLAWLALSEVGAFDHMSEGQFNAFWILFENGMKKANYIVEE